MRPSAPSTSVPDKKVVYKDLVVKNFCDSMTNLPESADDLNDLNNLLELHSLSALNYLLELHSYCIMKAIVPVQPKKDSYEERVSSCEELTPPKSHNISLYTPLNMASCAVMAGKYKFFEAIVSKFPCLMFCTTSFQVTSSSLILILPLPPLCVATTQCKPGIVELILKDIALSSNVEDAFYKYKSLVSFSLAMARKEFLKPLITEQAEILPTLEMAVAMKPNIKLSPLYPTPAQTLCNVLRSCAYHGVLLTQSHILTRTLSDAFIQAFENGQIRIDPNNPVIRHIIALPKLMLEGPSSSGNDRSL